MSVMKPATLDYGGLVSRRPERHLVPKSVTEVSKVVKEAARRQRRIVMRGRGHALNGQSQTTEWLLDTRRLDWIADPCEESIWVGAGTTWREVLRRCAQVGKCPPVLTDYLGLSVGGTLSVGGFGPASITRGLQVDHVLELEVVTGSGQIITCSSHRYRELFDACRAGFGQFGVITSARLRLEEMPNTVVAREHTCQDARTLMAQLHTFALSCDEAYGVAFLTLADSGHYWQFTATGIRRNFDASSRTASDGQPSWLADYWGYATRLDSDVSESWAESPRWRHPWIDVVLPALRAPEYLEMVQHIVSPTTLGDRGVVLVYPVRDGAGQGCFAPLLMRKDHVLIDLLRKIRSTDPKALEDALHENVRLLAYAQHLGGVLYAISAVDAEPAQWSRAAKSFTALSRQADPRENSVFVPLGERVMNHRSAYATLLKWGPRNT